MACKYGSSTCRSPPSSHSGSMISPSFAFIPLLSTLVLFTLLFTSTNAQPEFHNPYRWYRQEYWNTHGLLCFGSLPPSTYGNTPYTAANYESLTDLCSMDGAPARNLQGYCTKWARYGEIRFRWLRTPKLLRDPNLGEICKRSCICRYQWREFLEQAERHQFDEQGDWTTMMRIIDRSLEVPLPRPLIEDVGFGFIAETMIADTFGIPALLKEILLSKDPLEEEKEWQEEDKFTSSLAQMADEGLGISSRCGGRCIDLRCPHEENGCACTVSPTADNKWVPRGCRIVHDNDGLKKRGMESLSCPCNGTYVSDACCSSKDGIVWEDPSLRLGDRVIEEL